MSTHDLKTLNFAVVGFGKLGLLHASIVNALEGSRWTCAMDTQKLPLDFLRVQNPSLRTYSDVASMLDKERGQLHGVFVCTPPSSHVPIALELIENEIPVFIEKPLSRTRAEAVPLIEALRRKPITNMVGFMNRYSDVFIKAKQILTSNVLGRIRRVTATMYIDQRRDGGSGWRYSREVSGGGVLITQNCHLIDLLLWCLGEIRWVSAHLDYYFDDKIEDAAHVVLEFATGARGVIDTNWSRKGHRTLSTEIFVEGDGGTLEFNDDEIQLFSEAGAQDSNGAKWTQWKKPDLFSGVVFDVAGPEFTRQALVFIDGIRRKVGVESDISSALVTQTVLDAIYTSAQEQGVRVQVPTRAEILR